MRHQNLRRFIAVTTSVILTALLSAPATAANIAFVTFHPADDMPSAAAVTAGFNLAPDIGYTNLLTANGHTVTRVLTEEDKANVSSLNSYDLVILGRSVNSGHYDEDLETAAWNGLTTPLISIGGYPLRNNRLGYFTGTGIPDTTGSVKLAVTDPSHPIFAGIALDGANTMVNDYAGIVNLPYAPNTPQRGISVNTNPIVPGGVVLATTTVMTGTPPVATAGNVIAFLPKGTALATAPVDTLAGARLVFLTGSREDANPSDKAGIYDLTADGATMFLNAVNFMAAIPEPSTASLAMLALTGLGAMRRKARRTPA
jgi:hypothetical protein